jgi:endoglucanase
MRNRGLGAVAAALCLSACGGDDQTGGAVQPAGTVEIAASPATSPVTSVVAPDPATTVTPEAASVSSAATAAVPVFSRRGINISGGEFGGGHIPGKLFTDYRYPDKAEIDYYARLGFNIIRVPFLWERLQPTLYGPLSVPDQQALRDVVTYANARGMVVVLDMHNYGQRGTGANYQTFVDIGSAQVPGTAFLDGWMKIATAYASNPDVWLGLMNEPHTMAPTIWWPVVQKLVNGMRARGIKNRLLVPGTAWTGAYSWVSSGNAAEALKFNDPLKTFDFEVHQYLDADSSGTSPVCVSAANTRVIAAAQWAVANHKTLFMGEMGAGSYWRCATEYPNMIKRIETTGSWTAWTAWGGGTWWNADYPFRTLTTAFPDTSTTTPHMNYLLAFIKK